MLKMLPTAVALAAVLACHSLVVGQPTFASEPQYIPVPSPGEYTAGETYSYSSYGQQPICPQTICTERKEECVDVCTEYETGCADECALYKTKYYEQRMEPMVEEIDVCLDVEKHEFTQCAEWEIKHEETCVQYETTTVNSCKRWETGLIAQCKTYDLDCYEECCEYESKKIDYCEKWDLNIWYINKKDDNWYDKPEKPHGKKGGHKSGYRRAADTNLDVSNEPGKLQTRQATPPEFVGMAGTPEQMAAFYEAQRQQALAKEAASSSASASESPASAVSPPPTGNDTDGSTGDYIYDANNLAGSHYGGEVVIVKTLPEQCACCEQTCAKKALVEFPTRWCKKKKTVCARSERCKAYEYKYYESPRCAEWHTEIVQTPNCLQWQPVSFNTGICTRYENKIYNGPKCARWGKLQYVSDKVPTAHVPYPSDECEIRSDSKDMVCWQTPVCKNHKQVCYPSTVCTAWGQCEAPTVSSLFGPGGQYGPPAPPSPPVVSKAYRRSIRGDTSDDEERRSLDYISPDTPVPANPQLHAYTDQGSVPPPANNAPSTPVLDPNHPIPGRFDYKYYETGYGLYNNFAFNPSDHREEYPVSKNALRDWIERVHAWRYAKQHHEEPENPPYFPIRNRENAYGPWAAGVGPKWNRRKWRYGNGFDDEPKKGKWGKKVKNPAPPPPGAVPVRVVIVDKMSPGDFHKNDHDGSYGKHRRPSKNDNHDSHGKHKYPSGY